MKTRRGFIKGLLAASAVAPVAAGLTGRGRDTPSAGGETPVVPLDPPGHKPAWTLRLVNPHSGTKLVTWPGHRGEPGEEVALDGWSWKRTGRIDRTVTYIPAGT